MKVVIVGEEHNFRSQSLNFLYEVLKVLPKHARIAFAEERWNDKTLADLCGQAQNPASWGQHGHTWRAPEHELFPLIDTNGWQYRAIDDVQFAPGFRGSAPKTEEEKLAEFKARERYMLSQLQELEGFDIIFVVCGKFRSDRGGFFSHSPK